MSDKDSKKSDVIISNDEENLDDKTNIISDLVPIIKSECEKNDTCDGSYYNEHVKDSEKGDDILSSDKVVIENSGDKTTLNFDEVSVIKSECKKNNNTSDGQLYDKDDKVINLNGKKKIKGDKKTDSRPFKCDFCDKDYGDRSKLNKHLLKHSDTVHFACPVCCKPFTEKTNLNKHLVIHTGRRDYVCNVCNLSYVRKAHLDRHFKVHIGEMNFGCSLCDKKFMYKQNLVKHLKTHDDRKFSCTICNKSYKTNEILIYHMKIHLNIKNNVCDFCDKRFIQKSHLVKHIKKYHELEKDDNNSSVVIF